MLLYWKKSLVHSRLFGFHILTLDNSETSRDAQISFSRTFFFVKRFNCGKMSLPLIPKWVFATNLFTKNIFFSSVVTRMRQEIPNTIIDNYIFYWSYDWWCCVRTTWWYFRTKTNFLGLHVRSYSIRNWSIFFNFVWNVHCIEIFHWIFYPGEHLI